MDRASLAYRAAFAALITWLAYAGLPAMAQEEKQRSYNKVYYVVDSVNPGLPKLEDLPVLNTPLATDEQCLFSARASDFERVAVTEPGADP